MKTGLNDAQAQFLAAEFVRPLAFFGAAFAAFNGLSKEHAWIVVSALILMAACAKSILSALAAREEISLLRHIQTRNAIFVATQEAGPINPYTFNEMVNDRVELDAPTLANKAMGYGVLKAGALGALTQIFGYVIVAQLASVLSSL